MARVKSKGAIRHRKVLDQAKGYKQARSSRFKTAKEAVLHAGQYAYHGRKRKKRDLRSLWITRIGAAAKLEGTNYNSLISGLKKANIDLDRKILANIAVSDPESFKEIVKAAK